MSKHILIVDDDALLRRSLAFNLEQAGYRASNAENAEDALLLARRDSPDLVLLDIGLPGMDGLDALRQFKEKLNLPVIFLTARRKELDEVLGLELGADDYITKPFDLSVLLARIKNVFRHMEQPFSQFQQHSILLQKNATLTVDDLSIDPSAHTVTVADKPIELTPREFDLLHTFALQPNTVLSVDDLIASVWGAEFMGQPQVVYVHIRWLREKIEADPNHPKRLITVRGVGYKLIQQG
jgi:DNA-binding response OmpR family regulator